MNLDAKILNMKKICTLIKLSLVCKIIKKVIEFDIMTTKNIKQSIWLT